MTILINMEQQLTLRLYDTDDQKEFILALVYAKCDKAELNYGTLFMILLKT